jgi:hypothetical protein
MPCVHVETRMGRALACKQIGIFQIQNIPSGDWKKAFAREFVLSSINWKKLNRKLDDLAGSNLGPWIKTRSVMKARIEELILDSLGADSWNDLREIPIQECLERFKFLGECIVSAPLLEIIERSQPKIDFNLLW